METLIPKSLEKYTSQFEVKELKALYESIGYFLDIAVEKVTPEMVMNMPEISEKDNFSTSKAGVLARYHALRVFGIYPEENDVLDYEFVLESADDGMDQRRSNVITTFAVYKLIPEFLGLTSGLGVKKRLDESGFQVKDLFPIKG